MEAATLSRQNQSEGPEGAGAAPSTTCLLLVVAMDLALVVLHVVHRLSPILGDSPIYALGADGGYAEMFQYLKTGSIVIALGFVCARTREPVYGAWSLLYAYFVFDDALRIHETLGGRIAAAWNYAPAFGLRAKDFGELTVSVIAGSALLTVIAGLYARAKSEAKRVSEDLALLLGVLVFFGVFVDLLHIVVQGHLKDVFAILEDGGELVAMTATFWCVLRLAERPRGVPTLWQSALATVAQR